MGEMVHYQTYADMDERRIKAEKEIERLREKIVRAYACIEDKLYDKDLNILRQALKENE